MTAVVGIIMGSVSDWETMRHAADVLEALNVPHEVKVVSAHRTPRRMVAYAESAADRGLKVIVAGAGGAAHLPGMVASLTPLPVLGVPGWWPDNADPGFYADTSVFRPKRTG